MMRNSLGDILENLNMFINGVNDAIPEVLEEGLRPTFDKSLEYCPVASGVLRDSGYLEVESFRGKHVVAIGYGKGGRPSYAVFVHEMPFAHEAPTRSKFLEAALDEDYDDIKNKIPQLLKDRVGT